MCRESDLGYLQYLGLRVNVVGRWVGRTYSSDFRHSLILFLEAEPNVSHFYFCDL